MWWRKVGVVKVGVVAENHGGGGLGEAVLGEEGDKTELGQEAGF